MQVISNKNRLMFNYYRSRTSITNHTESKLVFVTKPMDKSLTEVDVQSTVIKNVLEGIPNCNTF